MATKFPVNDSSVHLIFMVRTLGVSVCLSRKNYVRTAHKEYAYTLKARPFSYLKHTASQLPLVPDFTIGSKPAAMETQPSEVPLSRTTNHASTFEHIIETGSRCD